MTGTKHDRTGIQENWSTNPLALDLGQVKKCLHNLQEIKTKMTRLQGLYP